MSLKATFFQTALRGFAPANIYKFRLLIEAPHIKAVMLAGAWPLTCLCKSATVPQRSRLSVPVPIRGGNTIEYPGVMQTSGDFTFSCYEAQDGVVRHQIDALMNVSDQRENNGPFFNLTLTQLQGPMNVNMPEVKLEGCFVKSRGPVVVSSESATTAQTYEVTIHYNRIIEEYTAADLPLIKLAEVTAAYGIVRAATFAGPLAVLTADPTGLLMK